jgi:oligopeptidase B
MGDSANTERGFQVAEAIKPQQPIDATSSLPAPVAPRRPHSFTVHGVTIVDDYAWLKDKDWQEVLRDPSVLNADIRGHLEAENDYTDSLLGHTAPCKRTLLGNAGGSRRTNLPACRLRTDGPYAYFAQIPRGRPARKLFAVPPRGWRRDEFAARGVSLRRT